MSQRPTLQELFGEFHSFIHTLKYRSHLLKYSPDDIEAHIYFYETREALSQINNALASLESTIQELPDIVQFLDAKDVLIALGIENYSIREEGLDLSDAAPLHLTEHLNYIHSTLANIKVELQAMLPNRDIEEKPNPILVIDENFDIVRLKKENEPRLDIYQTALLLHFLKEANVIQPYGDISLGKIASVMTGHSENTLAKKKGFGAIHHIMTGELANKELATSKSYNLEAVEKCLTKF